MSEDSQQRWRLISREPFLASAQGRVVIEEGGQDLLASTARVFMLASFVNSGMLRKGPPRADICLFQCDDDESQSIIIIDLEPIINCSEEETPLAATILLTTLLCTRAMLVYSCEPGAQSVLKQFALLDFVTHQYFHADRKAMRASVGGSVELVFLSSEKGTKNGDKIVGSILQYEEGFDDSIVARNQVRECITEVFSARTGASISALKPDDLEGLLSSGVCSRIADLNGPFYDGFANIGILILEFILLCEHNMASATSLVVPDSVTLNSWKSECVDAFFRKFISEQIENYDHVMQALYEGFNSFEDLEVAHKREKSKAMTVFDCAVHSYSVRSAEYRKQLQVSIREKKDEFMSALTAKLADKIKSIYKKHYHQLEAAKQSSTSQSITLVDAGSPYSNLVYFKGILSTYLSVCRQELATVDSVDDSVLVGVLITELQNIIDNSRLWVDGFEALYQQALISKTTSKELLRKLLEDDRILDTKLKEEEIENERLLSELEEQLTQQRISQSSDIEEKSSRVEVLGDKVERAARLNENEKSEVQAELMSIQSEIQGIQQKSFEKRQERELKTSDLHRQNIEQERESHEWFKDAIHKQHELLEKELSLERKISEKRNMQMTEKFKMEAEQLHELENIRLAGQTDISTFKEARMKQREKEYKEHEALLTRYNAQINELDTKLALTSAVQDADVNAKLPTDGGHSTDSRDDHDKKCSIM